MENEKKGINEIRISGRLATYPELSYTKNGVARVTARIAVNPLWTPPGEKPQAEFHNLIAFGDEAMKLHAFAAVGQKYLVKRGQLQSRSWHDESGQRRERVEIVVREGELGSAPIVKPEPGALRIGPRTKIEGAA